MRKIAFILLLLPSLMMAQFNHEVYFDFSVDANKLTGLIDNPRTAEDHTGLDFDFEIGVTTDGLGAYMYYGRFDAANYQNYGFGIDYYIVDNRRYEWAAGLGLSRVLRKLPTGADYEREAWLDLSGYANYAVRTVGTYWIFENLGLSGRLQYHRRPDIEVHGIVEGAVGVKYKFHRR